MAAKTNAVRLLDQLRIPYELREYEVDPKDLAAETVAARIGLPPEQVFKTLVARGERNGVCMAVIPGDQELNLKALAGAAGEPGLLTVNVAAPAGPTVNGGLVPEMLLPSVAFSGVLCASYRVIEGAGVATPLLKLTLLWLLFWHEPGAG